MIELLHFIRESFPLYFGTIFRAPSILIQEWRGTGIATLAVSLIVGTAMIFLCARLVKKYDLEFILSVILTTLILSLTVGLIGLFMSISSLGNAFYPFLIIGCGSPILNIVLSMLVVRGNRLQNNTPKAGLLWLCGVGLLFAWSLTAIPIIFFYALYNN
jgi:hypothetical protein